MRYQISTRATNTNPAAVIFPTALSSSRMEYSLNLRHQNDGPTRENLLKDFFAEMSLPLKSESFQAMLASEQALRKDWDSPEEDETWSHL